MYNITTIRSIPSKAPQCLTCTPEPEEPEPTPKPVKPKKKKKGRGGKPFNVMGILWRPCLYHNAIFSPGLSYIVLECLGPGIPTVTLYATKDFKYLLTLQNNSRLLERASEMAFPQVKTFPVQMSKGYHAQVRLHLPPVLREDEITMYPLVVKV